MTAYIVPLPFPCQYVSEEVLDRWYRVAREWDRLTIPERAMRYATIAATLVETFASESKLAERYADGYYLAEASGEEITVAAECIVARPERHSRIALVSARRYPRASFRGLLRDAVRMELEEHGLLVQNVLPKRQGYTIALDLIDAWKATRPKLV